MSIIAIAGSLRSGAYSKHVVNTISELARNDVDVDIYEGLGALPHYDQDLDTSDTEPDSVAELRARISAADALLVVTPEYNGSLPGALKNAIDWASRPYGESSLSNKPTIVVSASPTEYGAAWARADGRRALGVAGATVLDHELGIAKVAELYDESGRLNDESVRADLAEVLVHLEAATQVALAA